MSDIHEEAEAASPAGEQGAAPPKAAPGADGAAEAKGEAKGETGAAPPAAPAEPNEPSSPPLIPPGNPMRWLRGGITALVPSILAFCLMAHNGQLRFGVPLGIVLVAIASFGVMDMLGTFDDADDRVAAKVSLNALLPGLGGMVASLLAFCAALSFAGSGAGLPQWMWGIVVTLAFIGLAASTFDAGVRLGVFARDENGEQRSLLRRHGFWVIVAAAALYFPFMGSFSLWDPWETHYGEVSREILARDDWISLWWAQDGWFWSKPILNFWMQAISMASLGLHYMPDQMLVGADTASHDARMHPEWIVRAPVVVLTILSMYLLYKGVAKGYGRRAGLLGALVLATMPDWFFLAHQTMTDMPFVAPMTATMGLLLLGLNSKEGELAKVYQVGKFRFSGWHLVFGAVLLCVIPQVLYLLSRNLELVLHGTGPHGFRPHLDEFRSGSGGGNCGLPGNEACAPQAPAAIPKNIAPRPDHFIFARVFFSWEPFEQAILWTVILGVLLAIQRGERRVRRLYYLAAWFFAAIATMGKGPAGFGLPMLCAFMYVCSTKSWKELTRLEIWSGFFLLVPCVALPWFVAMYVRHGSPFTDRLIFHDMFNRAFHHVHDTNEGDDTSFRFYLWQLGYALFPWTGLAPLGLMWWMRKGDTARRGTAVLLFMWFLFAFALFSFMGTKFHHYIFPAVPPVAMLIGIVLDAMIGPKPVAERTRMLPYGVGMGAGAAIAAYGAARFWPGSPFGGVGPKGELFDAGPVVGAALIALGAAVVIAVAMLFRARHASAASAASKSAAANDEPDFVDAGERRRAHAALMFAGSVVASALLLVLVGRDLAYKTGPGDTQPGAIRLLQLFTYNYKRPWPESLDFSAVLAGFALIAVIVSLAMSARAIRRHAVAAFVGLAFVWALWGEDVYMVKTAPHWGQHEVIEAYYRARKDPSELLVAYQMNWKGENFYTGNRIPAFVSTGSAFTTWLKKEKDGGAKVMFFVTEHGRIGGLKSEVGARAYQEMTTKELCNKFVLVRAEF